MKELFVSNEENDLIVQKIFTILGYSVLTLVVYGTLIWAYSSTYRNQYLFISIFSLFVLFYAIIVVSIVVINKSNYDPLSYLLLFGITIFAIFTSVFVCIFFILKYFNILSSSVNNSNFLYSTNTANTANVANVAANAAANAAVNAANVMNTKNNYDYANMDYRRTSY
jgi:hypothetical protein